MDYITLAPESELPKSLEEVDAHSIYAAFEKITNGHCKRGRRYSVALILTLIVLAKLMGGACIENWQRLHLILASCPIEILSLRRAVRDRECYRVGADLLDGAPQLLRALETLIWVLRQGLLEYWHYVRRQMGVYLTGSGSGS